MERRSWIDILVAGGVACQLFYYMSAAKFSTARRLSTFSPTSDAGLFWTESAFHYHYAKLAASGDFPAPSRLRQPSLFDVHGLRIRLPVAGH